MSAVTTDLKDDYKVVFEKVCTKPISIHTDKGGEMINSMVGTGIRFSNSRLRRDRLDICLSLIEEDHHIRAKRKSRCLQSIVGSQTAQWIDDQ